MLPKGRRAIEKNMKPKHPLKLHVWAEISGKGATNCIFDGKMDLELHCRILETIHQSDAARPQIYAG